MKPHSLKKPLYLLRPREIRVNIFHYQKQKWTQRKTPTSTKKAKETQH